jgi:alpha-L-rhamnosidase
MVSDTSSSTDNSSTWPGAQWIAYSPADNPRELAPAPYFRKVFRLGQPVASAHLVITALGLYEAELNGRRIGDHVFAPGWTNYNVRVPYRVHDVTALLCPGENVLGVILGVGWYCGYLGWKGRQTYGPHPSLLCSLRVSFTDGSSLIIGTDNSWKTAEGPILENDLLMGETYDARLELGNWSRPDFDDSRWAVAAVFRPPSNPQLTLHPGPPVRRIQEIKPISARDISAETRIYDLGQNFAGRVSIKVKAPPGEALRFRHAEVLTEDGELYTENLRRARATDRYICKGGAFETWEPRFTFHGFRYVEVQTSSPIADIILEITGIVLHSDIRPTGSFSCSHQLLNQLQHNIVWGQKSNFLEVPTDCPQRDERLGWTGDAQVFVRTACFNMDVRLFFHKWMQDIRDSQSVRGGIPSVNPDPNDIVEREDGGPAWSDATIICPWTIYLCYGDRDILQDHYASMARYMDFMATYRCKGHIRSHPEADPWGGFGDWLALDGSGKTDGGTPRDLIGTAFYAYDSGIMSRIASILGFDEDARRYSDLHIAVTEAFQRTFVNPNGIVASGTQTAYVLALYFGLIPEDARKRAVAELLRKVEENDYHLATGFVGTPYLLDVLESHGYLDVAYRLLEQESFPSWLFPVKNGATTVWERWDGWTPEKGFQDKGMNSFNHYAYGAVGAWMVRTVAGLDLDPGEPGYRHIIFRPRPGGSIKWAEAKLETPSGLASIRWDLESESLRVEITVPPGCHATLSLPEEFVNARTGFGPGSHRIVAPVRRVNLAPATASRSSYAP